MKILDRYIFLSFIKTFTAVFIILMFIFVLQGIWLHISELAGKDLDYTIIARFLVYITPSLVPLVLPLTILVTSIMTFGSFAENYEFAAMKSSGISLQRAMRSLIFFISFLSITAFFFANNVIPWAEFKSINLRKNISKLKPAMAIVEGAFNDIGDVNIKVDKKTGDNDQYLHDVIIHNKKENLTGNYTVIKAKKGELIGSEDSDILSLVLTNGNYYDELHPKDYEERKKKPYVKSYFDEYTINIDLSSFNNVDFEDERYNYSYKMLDVPELRIALDSLSEDLNQDKKNFSDNLMNRSGLENIGNPAIQKKDTAKTQIKSSFTLPGDTITYNIASIKEFYNSYKNKQRQQIANIALGTVRGTLSNINGKKSNLKRKVNRLNKTEIQLHEKFALAAVCFILFFVGAPLGAIIRKGGLGLPMVIAILLFLTYHFIGIFAKNSAEDGTVSPFVATWLSSFIMFPLSIYLTYRATTDQGFINTDIFTEPVKKFFRKIGIVKKEKELIDNERIVDLNKEIFIDVDDIALFENYDNKKLKDLVKNYKAYGFSEDHRIAFLRVLFSRGITQEDLKNAGDLYNKEYIKLEKLLSSLKINFKITNALYIFVIVFPIVIAIFNNNSNSEVLLMSLSIFTLLLMITFYICLFKLDKNFRDINKIVNNADKSSITTIFLLIGPVFYFLFYFYYKNQIKLIKQGLISR